MKIRWQNSRSPLGRYVTCMWSVPDSSRTYCVPQAQLLYSVRPDTVTAPYLAGIAPFTAALQLDLGVFNVLLCAGPELGRKWDQTDPKISPSFVTIQVNEFHPGGKRLLPMSDFITFGEFKC